MVEYCAELDVHESVPFVQHLQTTYAGRVRGGIIVGKYSVSQCVEIQVLMMFKFVFIHELHEPVIASVAGGVNDGMRRRKLS